MIISHKNDVAPSQIASQTPTKDAVLHNQIVLMDETIGTRRKETRLLVTHKQFHTFFQYSVLKPKQILQLNHVRIGVWRYMKGANIDIARYTKEQRDAYVASLELFLRCSNFNLPKLSIEALRNRVKSRYPVSIIYLHHVIIKITL